MLEDDTLAPSRNAFDAHPFSQLEIFITRPTDPPRNMPSEDTESMIVAIDYDQREVERRRIGRSARLRLEISHFVTHRNVAIF